MKNKRILAVGAIVVALAILVGVVSAAQDKWAVKSPNNITFSEFKGYETWQDVAVSDPEDVINVIAANPVMIDAYKSGIPGNGKPFPDGSMVAKIAWTKKQMPESPYPVTVPDTLKMVSFIMKDAKRFPETSGWGYAQFLYDAKSGTFSAFGSDASFGKKVCYQCHTAVKIKDFIFTNYPYR